MGEANKCAECGLVNFSINETCRRCGSPLVSANTIAEYRVETEPARGFGRKLLWVFGMTLTLLLVCFASLLATSDGLDFDQRRTVADAVAVLEQAGFSNEAFALGTLVTYRGTDNWWNRYVGHLSAYAATNFPF